MSKLALGLAGAGGATGLGAVGAYQAGLFSSTEEDKPLTVKEVLSKEGYELAKDDAQFKTFFTEFKTDDGFIKEVNKHSDNNEDLKSDNGEKGKLALKALCSSYLETKDNLDKAVKWCVLRIQDKPLSSGKNWIPTNGNNEETEWKSAFETAKTEMARLGIEGITAEMNSETGHPKIKKWCLENKKLPINIKNQTVQNNVISWCSKQG
ncbi:hypothetical protein HF1_03500 [Mycoplasma haemofelis str. Langford 1]|uniref:Uncharacterized protein n=1 Tax=Mycoplasma haemofelis (strain Langford 1) TaxID=941640 RepID=E8ZGT7_MYCHL|nr:hypothetical protein [Mycoplasma haemofelis]CBY92358.1 hypothetical protein HF1_03500 [Mycoplasma haemofelis str. Langford 1]